jgi:ubiquinone/menaquinone biosynthesis C-methylase UbiE
MAQDDRYTLATGDLGVHRLSILNTIHKPYTEFLFRQVGLKPGMSVADIGCGIGNVSLWLAQQVGSAGSVCGVDISTAQLEKAQQNAMAEGLSNIKFTLGNAYNTGLSENSFDLVYCRFLLMHLTRPADALYHMQSLLKPGGFLVCEEADFSCAFCDPPSRAYERCFELFLTISDIRGQHFRLGTMLYRFFQDVGLVAPSVSLVQPVVVLAETKSLVDLSLFEAVDAFIEAELTTQQEIEQTLVQIRALAADQTTIFGIPRVTQVWAQK